VKNLIVVKKGQEAIDNRDVTGLSSDAAAIADLLKKHPEGGLTFYRHTCRDNGYCEEEEFKPKAKAVEPAPAAVPAAGKPVKSKGSKKK
jgi:hypothetical protein